MNFVLNDSIGIDNQILYYLIYFYVIIVCFPTKKQNLKFLINFSYDYLFLTVRKNTIKYFLLKTKT